MMYYFVCDQIFDFQSMSEISRDDPFARAKTITRIYDCVSGLRSDVFGAQEFAMADLVTPERDPIRMKHFLSELVNFYYFKCERAKELDAVNAEIECRRREVDEERIFEENAVEALDKARTTQQEAHDKKIAMMHKSTEVQKELATLRESRQELKRIWEAKQATEAEQLKRIEQLESAIMDATEKGKRLDMNIVSSPDRIVSDIEGMRKEVVDMEEKQVAIDQEVRSLERVISNYKAAKRITDNLHGELKHLEHYKEKLTDSRRTRDESQQRLKEVEMESRTMELGISELKVNNEAKIRKLKDQEQQDNRRAELSRAERENLKKDEGDLKERRARAKDDLKAGQVALKEREQAVVELGKAYDKSIQELLDGERRMEEAVERERGIVDRTLQLASGTFAFSKKV